MAKERAALVLADSSAHSDALFTRPFVTLCLTMFLAFATHAMIVPAVPLYVHDLGGSASIAGLVLLAFSLPSISVRPYLGRLADRWSSRGMLVAGLLCAALGSVLLLVPLLSVVFIAAVIRGLGWAGVNIGGYTTLAMAAPDHRRGEAAGYYTSAVACTQVAFPALALWMIEGHGGFVWVFVVAAATSLLAAPAAVCLPDARPVAENAKATTSPRPRGLIDRSVLVVTALNLTSTLAMPAAIAFIPLYARSLGIEGIGYFYVLAGVTNIVIRPLLGRRSDSLGRGPSIALGLGAQLLGFILIVMASSLPMILIGGVFAAAGSALIGSATTALAIDLANPQTRGRSMATYSISYQLGSGGGAIIAGTLADFFGFHSMYLGSIFITLAGLTLLAVAWKALPGSRS
jgi:MFS family permease